MPWNDTDDILAEINQYSGMATNGRPVTEVLYVSPDGSNLDGKSWETAYTTIQAALDVASTDANDLTLILLAPRSDGTFYDINTTGNPSWSCNVEIKGSHRLWCPIKNTHATATSVFKFTGYASLSDLAIYITDEVDGVIFTNNAFRMRHVGINATGLTGAADCVYIDGSGGITGLGIIEDLEIRGHVTHATGIHINQSTYNYFGDIRMHEMLKGVFIEDTDSDNNYFCKVGIGGSATAFDIDGGNEQHFIEIYLHENTTNFDDSVGDHQYENINAEIPVTVYPTDMTGVAVATGAGAAAWSAAPVEVVPAASRTKPFRIVGYLFETLTTEMYQIRFSADGGTNWFTVIQMFASKQAGTAIGQSSDYVFNKGTQIVASSRDRSGGDSVNVWVEIQEI